MKATEFGAAKTAFTNIFNLRISDFMDKEFAVGFGEVLIDVERFDGWLHKQHGDYEDRNLSMDQIITEQYGDEARELISRLVLGN